MSTSRPIPAAPWRLAQQGIMSPQTRDEKVTALQAAKAAVDAARDNLAAAQANLRQARAHELLTDASARTVDQTRADEANARALAEQARVEEGYAQIVSPINGKVDVWAARQGEVVTDGRAHCHHHGPDADLGLCAAA